MAAEDIVLTTSEMETFIDLWEAHRLLWDHCDPNFKNRSLKQIAYGTIANEMGKSWTTDHVKRKIDSLNSYYRTTRRKIEEGKITESPGGSSKKIWIHFDRIRSFLSRNNYDKQNALTNIQEDFIIELAEPEEEPNCKQAKGSGDHTSDNDLALCKSPRSHPVLTNDSHTTSRSSTPAPSDGDCDFTDICCKVETSPTHQTSRPPKMTPSPIHMTPVSAVRKRTLTEKCHSTFQKFVKQLPALDTSDVGLSEAKSAKHLTSNMAANHSRKVQATDVNPNANYGVYVVERLDTIKNKKRLLILKHSIDNLIHEAIMEEMSDD